ncbi:MAG: helix-turn-helix domain-containing protein [Planctomycetes bacterium]|nr:helix-turn-helix domain-containing protein [Planctomycetota bacterium]
MSEDRKEILTIDEACDLLGISAKTFSKILREEDIPGRKIGREWKFSRQALIDWVGSARARDFLTSRRKKRKKNVVSEPEKTLSRPPPLNVQGSAIREERFSIEED